MRFHYTAVTKESKRVEGSAEATNKQALVAALTKQGVRPLVIKLDSDKPKRNLSLGRNKIKTKDMVVFTRQLSTMISAGVPLARSLSTLQAQTGNTFFKKKLGGVVHDVESGVSLADSLAKYPEIFSSVYVNMVRAGEAGGILDDVLQKLALQQEKDAAIRNKVKSASIYPMILISITVIAFFALTIIVIPKIGTMLKEIGGEETSLPLVTTIMLGISNFIRSFWYLIFAVFLGGGYYFRRWKKTPRGKAKFDALLLRTPIIKTIVTKVAIARFARTFSSLTGAGVSVLETLEVTGKAIGNDVIEKELREASKSVKNGKQLSEPLSGSAHFPPIISQMLAVGEETGDTEKILVKVAEFYEQEVDAEVDGLSSALEPIMIVIMGGMVGLVAYSVIGPISSLSQNIDGSILIPNFVLTVMHLWL